MIPSIICKYDFKKLAPDMKRDIIKTLFDLGFERQNVEFILGITEPQIRKYSPRIHPKSTECTTAEFISFARLNTLEPEDVELITEKLNFANKTCHELAAHYDVPDAKMDAFLKKYGIKVVDS